MAVCSASVQPPTHSLPSSFASVSGAWAGSFRFSAACVKPSAGSAPRSPEQRGYYSRRIGGHFLEPPASRAVSGIHSHSHYSQRQCGEFHACSLVWGLASLGRLRCRDGVRSRFSVRRPKLWLVIWVVVKSMVPFGYPKILGAVL